MIESLYISNFECHAETKLTFHKGVNVILGSTDSGKSSLRRALEYVIWNNSYGDYRSWWGGDTFVEIKLSDENIVRRKTDKNGNTYFLNKEKFKAFGQKVPEEIAKAINFTEVNMQHQLDNHFLLSETPGKVAEYFNKIARLDKIDKSQKHIQANIRATNAIIAYDNGFTQAKEAQLKKYDNLVNAEVDLIVLEKHEARKNIYKESKRKLEQTLNYIQTIEDNLEELDSLLQMESSIDKVLIKIKQKENEVTKRMKLSSLILKIKEKDKRIKETVFIVQMEQSVVKLTQLQAEKSGFESKSSTLFNVVCKLHAINKKLLETAGKLKQMENKWHKEFPDVCPLCGTKLK